MICVSTPAAARYGSSSRSLSAPSGRPLHVISASRFFIDEGEAVRSYSLQVRYRALILHIARVQRGSRLKQDDMRFLQRVRHVLGAVRDNQKLTRTHRIVMLMPAGIAPLHVQFALHHQQHFIFSVMMVPHELALNFYQLYLEVIQFTHDLRTELVLKRGKLLRQVDDLHGFSSSS